MSRMMVKRLTGIAVSPDGLVLSVPPNLTSVQMLTGVSLNRVGALPNGAPIYLPDDWYLYRRYLYRQGFPFTPLGSRSEQCRTAQAAVLALWPAAVVLNVAITDIRGTSCLFALPRVAVVRYCLTRPRRTRGIRAMATDADG